uniref:Uncharacterized protein n=1 Tax=Grammatophora oceanica TaxID=210454 RepID=A0A7S1UMW5_9STRA|eukprot:CAMPEP_0194047022 /NCGR_PEP_ID=MMETSP0009_2-20130614/23509_1 /TAXON_ID=210454 /ORGANISM="Grammatophora oceanica, Strain CCMP 410" /LENGTH=312 /DNA_ID=CAMNT_0038692531 /DNA_START=50 /DNA_END=988 /DNA_ORIENTATION=+
MAKSPFLGDFDGQIVRFWVLTIPLFILYLWFLYLAWKRPEKEIFNINGVDDDETIKAAYRQSGERWIPLLRMIQAFVITEGIWLTLLSYFWIFFPRRRNLMKSYLTDGEQIEGGYIAYEPNTCGNFADNCGIGEMVTGKAYAELEYTLPNDPSWMVKKGIRVQKEGTRTDATLLMLPHKPLSAQPMDDVELDVSRSDKRAPSTKWFALFSLLWALFCFGSAWYVYRQMKYIDENIVEDFENMNHAWKWILWGACVGAPLAAFASIILRWGFFRNWILNRGKVLQRDGDSYRKSSKKNYRNQQSAVGSDYEMM